MSDKEDDFKKKDDAVPEMKTSEILKQWPVFDIMEFDVVTIDATKWDDDTYTVMFNFYESKEVDEPPYGGYTLCTQIAGETLAECFERVELLLASGLFDGVNVSTHGTLWDMEGNEIEDICWTDHCDDIEDFEIVQHGSGDDEEDDELKIPPGTTIQ
jgi:hypothetical protein